MERAAKILAVLGLLVLCGSVLAVDGNEPIAHWKFDEGSGTIAYDSAGTNDGTVYGAVWTDGQIDGALEFDGDNDYVVVADDDSLTPSSALSISAWVYIDSISWSDRTAIVYKYYYRGDRAYFLGLGKNNDPNNKSTVCMNVSQTVSPYNGKITFGTTELQAGQWYHVAVTFEANHQEVYVNGTEETDDTDSSIANSIPNNAQPLYIGYHKDERTYFDGLIDDVRIYDRALSAEEIKQVYVDGLSSFERAIIQIEDAVAEKEEMLEVIDETLDKEVDAYNALEELLESGDYGDLKKGDIVTAKQKIYSAVQHEEQSMNTLEKSIEKLEDSLSVLGYEVDPNGSNK